MKSVSNVLNYIESFENFQSALLLLHETLENLGLRAEFIDAEPKYFKNEKLIMGFRVFENHGIIWFQNDDLFSKNYQKSIDFENILGVFPVKFNVENPLDINVVKVNVRSAIQRLSLENEIKKDFKDSENQSFEEYLNKLSKGKRIRFAELLASLDLVKTQENFFDFIAKNKNV